MTHGWSDTVLECNQPWEYQNMDQTHTNPWVMSGEYQNMIRPTKYLNDGQTEMTHGWWVESIRTWSALGVNDGQTEHDDPWVMSGEYQNMISPGLHNDGQTEHDDPWVMSGEYQNVISPGISTMDKLEMTHGWWVESIRMWSALGYQRWTNRWPMGDEWRVSECDQPWDTWTNRDDPWVMSGEYQNVISPGLSNDGQTEMTHGWWVESIRMWSALGYQRWTNYPWVMSGEYQNVISPGLSTMDKHPWVMSGEYQNVIRPGLQRWTRWPMGDEWRVSECDQPWVINDGQSEMTHGWWVESIRMWSATGLSTMDKQNMMTHGWWVESIRMWSDTH